MDINNYEYELLFELADNDDLFAIRKLVGYYFDDGKNYIDEHYFSARNKEASKQRNIVDLLKILIEKKDSAAMLSLGAFYYGGDIEFVEQDYAKAIYWYNEASKNKPLDVYNNIDSSALNNLGYCYYYGRSIEPDYKKAFFYYAKAACLDHPNAMYKIGDMYREGLYINKDINKAFYWYNQAHLYSRNDHYIKASISLRLGRAYLEGEGTEISQLKALKYLQSAERHFYSLLIEKPVFSNSCYAPEPFKKVQELLERVRKQLNDIINSELAE